MSLPKDLMQILACPRCKGSIEEENMFIVCEKCKLAYPILNASVPDMLVEDVWKLDKAKKVKFKHNLKL